MNRIVMTFLLASAALLTWAGQDEPIVREVAIQHIGPPGAADSVIRAHIRTAVGQAFSDDTVNDDVRSLAMMGWFNNVQVRREILPNGVKVIFVLQGKAKIRDIVIQGNKRFRADKLRGQITFKVGDPLDGRKVEESAAKLVDFYQKQGYQQAKVTHEDATDPDTGQAVVTFHVEEGLRVVIDRVDFVGNKAFPTKTLRRQMRTKSSGMFSWIMRGNRLREEVFEEDKERLQDFYRSHGYIDMEVRDVRIEKKRADRVRILITLFEGKQYKVGEIKFVGNEKFPTPSLTALIKMTDGKTFAPAALETDVQTLRDFYGSKGYIDLSITPDRSPNVQTGRMDIVYRIREGEINTIEKIEIRNNTRTKDRVIRRELAVRPGQVFDMVRVRRSQQRLENLNYFSKVVVDPESTEIENRKNLIIEVEEKRTGSVNFGAGAGSVEQVFGFFEVTQSNFDAKNPWRFEGGGQKMRLRTSIGTRSQYYLISFTEPWFLDKKLSVGFDLFRDELRFFEEYRLAQIGGNLRVSKALTEYLTGELKYELKSVSVQDVSSLASTIFQTEEETTLKSSVTASFRYDTRDSIFNPTRGNRTVLSGQLAGGPFGGDESIYRVELESTWYYSPWFDHIVMFEVAGGVVDTMDGTDRVPIFDRLFLGGPNNLRGFRFNDVGPKDPNVGTSTFGDPIGGQTFARATLEYTVPIIKLPRSGVRVAAFYDVGQVWAEPFSYNFGNINNDFGLGLRLDMIGIPIRIDYAIPLQTDQFNDSGGRINFSLGYQF